MIKISFIICLFLGFSACSKQNKNPNVSDDYVLIEFAARLEEDQYRIYPESLENSQKIPSKNLDR